MKFSTGSNNKYVTLAGRDGVITIYSILVLGAVLLAAGLALATGSFIESGMSSGHSSVSEALSLAEAGVSDAQVKLARDKDFSHAGYTFSLGSGSVLVVVESDQPVLGQSRITATGRVGRRYSKIQVVVVRGTYGDISRMSWDEID